MIDIFKACVIFNIEQEIQIERKIKWKIKNKTKKETNDIKTQNKKVRIKK